MREEEKRYDVIREQLVTRHETRRDPIDQMLLLLSVAAVCDVVVVDLVTIESIERLL